MIVVCEIVLCDWRCASIASLIALEREERVKLRFQNWKQGTMLWGKDNVNLQLSGRKRAIHKWEWKMLFDGDVFEDSFVLTYATTRD